MEQLDALLSKIQSDGVDRANAQAAKIVAEAKAQADALLATAKAEAAAAKADAVAEAERASQGAQATIRQAARDVLLQLEKDIDALLVRTLGGEVATAMAAPKLVTQLVSEAVASYVKSGEVNVVVGPELVASLKAALAKQGEVTVVTDAQTGAGFKVRLAGGRVEHDFTAEAVTDALAELLRPQLAALIKA